MTSALRQTEDETILPAPANSDKKPHADNTTYQQMYQESIENPDAFWAKQAERLDWIKENASEDLTKK